MADPFLQAAGPAPARHHDERWRQVALLGVSAAAFGDARARSALVAALLALDCPAEAARAAADADGDPWARWWGVLAAGQAAGAEGLGAALGAARAAEPVGPDGREVARRMADLDAELAELGGGEPAGARFSLLGHRARPERRVLVVGRSSAAFLLDPSWDALNVVRLAPSDGPSAGNGAHLSLDAVIGQVRRGESGPGRTVPADFPAAPDPSLMLEALREDPAARDRRLIELAAEVRAERDRLAGERAELEAERAAVVAERARLRRVRPASARRGPAREHARPPRELPRTRDEALALLALDESAGETEIERRYRQMVRRCHPDQVASLHPDIRQRAEDLTVALNAARDLLLAPEAPRRRAARG
jgi:DnaJ-domain-containing protein 1